MDKSQFRVTTTEVMGPKLQSLQSLSIGMALVGAILCVLGVVMGDLKGFFHSYLYAYMFWAGVTFGSLGLLMLHHTVGGGWGFMIRRFLEAGSRLLPLIAILFIPVVIGMTNFGLYEWTSPRSEDAVLQAKVGYLNVPFFLARAVIYFVVFGIFAAVLNKLGKIQDERADPDVSAKLNVIGGAGILIYVTLMTFLVVDWVLSLTPHWVSSIFGLLSVASQALSTFALCLALLGYLAGDSPFIKGLRTEYFRDLGNLTLATVMLWAYMSFSQYLITYSGNQVEEAVWFIDRNHGNWWFVAAALMAFHFFFPFLVLVMGSNLKRDPKRLGKFAIFLIVMRFVDLFWIVTPTFRPQFGISLADVGTPLLIGGIWLWWWAKEVKDKPVVPLHDPRFETHWQEAPAHG